jgi:sugar/nucleoside kinase (ribokinase family)
MILVFGTICLDRIRHVPLLPAPGGYVSVQDEETRLGGEAANTAYALAGWGAELKLVGNAVEPEVDRLLASRGLKRIAGSGSTGIAPVCEIYVTPDGQRTMFGLHFDQMAATIEPASIPVEPNGWFTMDMNFGPVGLQVAARAKASEMRLYLMDIVPDDAVELLGPGDVWQSSTDWYGHRGDSKRNLAWVERHAKRWRATVILTDSGRELAVGLPSGAAYTLPTFPPPLAKSGGVGRLDSTGAGDRFRAGMLFGLSQAWPVGECLAFASAAASMKVVHTGAIAPVPCMEAIEKFRRRHAKVDSAFAEIGIQ